MRLFGKPLQEYVRFSRGLLLVTGAVGILRLVLSLAGVPHAFVNPFSVTLLTIFAVGYFPVRLYQTGFGTYRHLLVLLALQIIVAESIVAFGLGITAATGIENIFSDPAHSGGAGTHWGHALSHLLGGPVIWIVIAWPPSALIMLITRRLWKNPRG